MESNKSQGCKFRCQNFFSSHLQCPKSTTLAVFPRFKSVLALLSDFIHSFSITEAHVSWLVQVLGIWRWGSLWSLGLFYSLYSFVARFPPGSQNPESFSRVLKALKGCLHGPLRAGKIIIHLHPQVGPFLTFSADPHHPTSFFRDPSPAPA